MRRSLFSLGIGAALAYLLDPRGGRRRRALLGDRISSCTRQALEFASRGARDLRNRSAGLLARLRRGFRPARGGRDAEGRLESERTGTAAGPRGARGRTGPRLGFRTESWPPAARLLAAGAGGGLFLRGLARRDPPSRLVGLLGGGLFLRAATDLPLNRLFGVRAGHRAVDLQKTIHLQATPERVYDFWTRFENFPLFMAHVREVRRLEGSRSHWVVSGPAGLPFEWDAVLTRAIPHQLLAWKTLPGSVVQHAGIIRFEPEGDRSTRVDIRMSYNPPAGAVGDVLLSLLGSDPRSRMEEDLARMKTLVETAKVPRDAAKPLAAGEPARRAGGSPEPQSLV